jgi:uncharacterized protein involved in type VI secretion and phage assembly
MIKQKIIFGIDRKEISHFTKIKLTQTINDHHFFKITVPQAVIEAQMAYTITKSQEWIGKTVHIQLENQNNFLGIIKHVKLVQIQDLVGNQIEISGYSKTDLLNSGKKRYSWENCTLKEIVESVLKKGVGKFRELKNQINPEYKHEIKYQTQYNETDFEFLQRLAKQYNEWFYYDCEKLFFGKPEKFDAMINLLFQSDLSHLKMALQALPHKLSGYTYDENSDTLYKVETNEEIEGLTQLGKHVFKASETLYNTPDLTQERISAGNEAGLEHSLNRKMQSIVSETEYVIARSRNPKLKIGSIIAISTQEKLSYNNKKINTQVPQYDTHGVGAYIITEITHKANDIGEYQNRFKALPAHITKLPEPQIAEPIAKSQEALVIANNDPMGYGRIRVRMQWQYGGMQTPWLRVMSADAGTSADVPTNRGNVFIPEVGDHVALNFWDDDPNKPFVIGSLFTGKTGRGGGANNDFRTITDGSGQYFELEKFKSITLSDQKGNMYHVDSVGDTLNIRALDTINFYAKNINLNASENLTANVGNVMTFNVVKTAFFNIFQKMQVNTPYLHQLITGLFHTNASKALINSDNEIKLESPEMFLAGQKKLFMHSDEVATLNSKGTVKVDGKQGNKQSNEAVSHETVKNKIEAKCIVLFRPKNNWQGEDYGFDWMRDEDTNLISGSAVFGDTKYEKIVSKQYKEAAFTTLERDQNEYKGFFKPTNSLYLKLKDEYQAHIIPWRTKKDTAGTEIKDTAGKTVPEDYFCSWLSLYPSKKNDNTPTGFANTKATLSLIIDIEEEPDLLRFEDNSFFTITPKEINVKGKGKTKFALNDSVTIECLKDFNINQTIRINSITKDDKGVETKKLAGKLYIWANNTARRKKAKILLVDVKMPPLVTGTTSNPGTSTGQQPLFEKYLRQALIETKVETKTLDVSAETDFVTKYVKAGLLGAYHKGTAPAGFKKLQDYLYSKLQAQLKKANPTDEHKYDNYFKAFYLGENGGYIDSTGTVKELNGYSSGNNVVLFPGKNDQTASHEFLHSFGLAHTFANKEAAPNALFTFEYAKTENLMDYSHMLSPPETRYSLWKWQWIIANASIKPPVTKKK